MNDPDFGAFALPYLHMNDPSLPNIVYAALRLPEDQRASLAARLIESLDVTVDDGVEAAWGDEIKKRIEEIDQGSVQMISWGEARQMILEGKHHAGPT